MILTAHQPVYIPWLGLFHKIALSDQYCIFDIAQYQTKDYNNRNKIKTSNGSIWLSVPVESKNHFTKSVGEIKIHQNGWQKKHFKSIDLAYKKAPFYSDYISEIEHILLGQSYVQLADLNRAFLEFGLRCLGIEVPIVTASNYNFTGQKSDLVLDMVEKLNANCYIFGAQGEDYAKKEDFEAANIYIIFQNYNPPVYQQLHGEFNANMSFLDLIFNVGQNSFNTMMKDNLKKNELLKILKSKGFKYE